MYFIIPFAFILGLAFGSFLNVLIDRIPNGENLFISRSRCEKCRKSLDFFDLIPLVSYLLLRGRCKYCHKKIPIRIFFVELLIGIVFSYLFLNYLLFFYNPALLTYLLIIFSIFITLFFIDLEFGILPDSLIIIGIIASLFYFFIFKSPTLSQNLLTGFFSFLVFLMLFLATKRKGMGFGDVKLSFLIGVFLGFPSTIVSFYLSFLTGAIVSIILVLWGKKSFHKGTIPFGPFLIAGAFITYFIGEKILIFIKQVLL